MFVNGTLIQGEKTFEEYRSAIETALAAPSE
jgi:hypothetical protein